ncbi:glycosyltransferase [Candidatus Saccharibacteria bacterium]|nr:glycosyltransferase [Candidatus Saccharibacteria bacterium]
MKVALVCDWLTNVGGAEKVLLELHHMYPKAPIYTSKYSKKGIDWFNDTDVRTGWLQIFPVCFRRILGPLRQRYFSHLDLSEYDLIISVTGAEAKAVKSGKWLHEHGAKNVKNPKGLHISFCHVPTQYYWQMYDDYVKNPGFGFLNPIVRCCFKMIVKPLRRADLEAAAHPDYYVTISEYAKEQIQKYYKREAFVIHPPVEIDTFRQGFSGAEDYYIVTSRQVNWKRLDLAIEVCLKLKRSLLVVGEGPEHQRLVKMAGNSDLIIFKPLVEKSELAGLLARAKGYLFPSMEPFGIAPVEALAAGCPVVAFGEGGARDYIKDGKNGLLFSKQTVSSLSETVLKFEKMKFERAEVAKTAEKFDVERFDKEMRKFVNEKVE